MQDRIQFEPLGINRDTRVALERKGYIFAEVWTNENQRATPTT